MDALILIGSFIALILIGMPVAYALGLSALIGAWWIDIPFQALMIQVAGGVNKFSLLAIPFFVLAGAIMAEGGMSRRLVAFAGVLVGFVRGGLSLVNIMASTFFGAISGSSVADTASIGSVLIPEMEKKALILGLLSAPAAPALTFKQIPATTWGHIYAGTQTSTTVPTPTRSKNLEVKSKFVVKYNNFPDWAKKEVQAAVNVWSANFSSSVPITVDASWGRSSSWGVLGSARPGSFFSAFSGAPDMTTTAKALIDACAEYGLDEIAVTSINAPRTARVMRSSRRWPRSSSSSGWITTLIPIRRRGRPSWTVWLRG